MQDFELESLLMGGDVPWVVKAASIKSDSNSKDCITLSSPTAVFRIKNIMFFLNSQQNNHPVFLSGALIPFPGNGITGVG